MSELYTVIVENVARPVVHLRVTTVHPDAGPPPTAPTFPINLLVDLWSLLDRGYTSLIGGVRLDEKEAVALARRAPWGPRMKALCELTRGIEAPISEAEYQALGAGGAPPERFAHENVGGWGMANGQHHIFLRGDPDEFARAVAPIVEDYRQEQLVNQQAYQPDGWPLWPSSSSEAAIAAYRKKQPSALLVVKLREPALLGFVRPQMSFDTASYY